MLGKFFGDRAFYSRVLQITLPIIVQRGVTNLVNLLDNVMVGQVGTLPMSGVSIANQLIFVFSLCIFGASSGAGIFTAQFRGANDYEGIRYTFRFKFLICTAITALAIGIFTVFGDDLIRWYLTGDGSPEDAVQTLAYGRSYLRIMFLGLLPFALNNVYATTLREVGLTRIPMISSLCAVFTNLILNYVLIFGHFGLPAMGVNGAAIATVISRYVELGVVAVWTHTHRKQCPYIEGAYGSPKIPGDLLRRIIIKGSPLLCNEFLWSFGLFLINQAYSTCGQDVVPAVNITSTLTNLTNVAFLALGSAVAIIMGQLLGAGASEEEARSTSRKLLTLSTLLAAVFAVVLFALAEVFPLMYNTTESVRQMSTELIKITALFTALSGFINAAYFILRSGGQTMVAFLFDCGAVWLFRIPVALLFTRIVPVDITVLYTLIHCTFFLQVVMGGWMIRKGKWIQQLTR